MQKLVNGVLLDLTEEEIAQNAIDAEASAAEYALNGYKSLRQAEYPPMEDYLDGIVKGDTAQVNKYIADCLAVKAAYPKGE
jgi:hypothetical protein